ncbi:MAG: type IV secretory system conjugative DNA transfer family protein [Bdellovibrionaceae bacterium]|nr:type IV secretory system conjugative DNA transfer family protein [Pseudobdellovibrionaceae bacterium]
MKKTNSDPESDKNLFLFAILIFSSVWIYKLIPIVTKFILTHKYYFGTGLSLVLTAIIVLIKNRLIQIKQKNDAKHILQRESENSFFIGTSYDGKDIFLPESSRTKHTQVVGTTSSGKTESVIIPWSIQDIKKGRGFIIIDGKSDRSLVDKLYAYAVKYKRSKDFRLFSLVNIEESDTYNPLAGGSPDEVAERVFSSFDFENEYYRNIQYEFFKQTLSIFYKSNLVPTFVKLIKVISDASLLYELALKTKDSLLIQWAARVKSLSRETLEERTSGLVNQLSHFASSETAKLFNSEHPSIDIEKAMSEGLILYFQLPVLKTPTLGKATGKMLLQNIQSAVSSRHLDKDKNVPLFSIFLDDFSEYLTPSFVSLLNKSRSANVGVVFAHQALGDLETLGDAIKNTILTNSNIKVFMRTNENESAEYFAKTCGTQTGTKTTDRQTKGTFGSEKTGDGSIREVEEFIYHPNTFKKELATGEAIMVVPFHKNVTTVRINLEMAEDLPTQKLPIIIKPDPLEIVGSSNSKTMNEKLTRISSSKTDIDRATERAS